MRRIRRAKEEQAYAGSAGAANGSSAGKTGASARRKGHRDGPGRHPRVSCQEEWAEKGGGKAGFLTRKLAPRPGHCRGEEGEGSSVHRGM